MTEPILTEPDDKLYLIGLLCSYWSYLELLFSAAIWNALAIDEDTGKIVTAGLDLRGRAAMAVRLCEHRKRGNDLIAALKDAQETVKDYEGERNLAVHGIYGLNPDTGEIHAEVSRGKFRGTPQEMPNERYINTIQALDALTERLEPILEKYEIIDRKSPPLVPSPQKYQPRLR